MNRVLALVAALVLAVVGLGDVVAAPAYSPDGEELAFLGIINDYRRENGRGELALSPTLGAAAEYHSLDMGTHGYFSHTLSDGTTAGENIANHGYGDETWGENIAGGMETARENFVAWRNSPGHDANMLRADFGAIGIGRAFVAGSPSGWYWTTTFGGEVDRAVRDRATDEPAAEDAAGGGDRPPAEPAADNGRDGAAIPDPDSAVPTPVADEPVVPAGEPNAGDADDAAAGGDGGSVTFGDLVTGNQQATATVVVQEPTPAAATATSEPGAAPATDADAPSDAVPTADPAVEPTAELATEPTAEPAPTDPPAVPVTGDAATSESAPTAAPAEATAAIETGADGTVPAESVVTPTAGPVEGEAGAPESARSVAPTDAATIPDCSAFATQAEAQAFYDAVGGAGSKDAVVAAFDPSYDGIACEEFKLP